MEMVNETYLPGQHNRARWMRIDSARIFKRLFFCERSLIVSQGAWLAGIAAFEAKVTLPRFMWQDAMAANALRDRVFELHYPSRLVEVGEDAPLVEVFDRALHAPSAAAYLLALARVFKPALLAIYQDYLRLADTLSDGPVLRHLHMAIVEKEEQVTTLTRLAEEVLQKHEAQRGAAEAWVAALGTWLNAVGGVSFEEPKLVDNAQSLPGHMPFQLAEVPARDDRFHRCRYYWPDIVDPTYPYGEGVRLQLRSAVSHLNEVWAVETGGVIIYAFANDLPWEFLYDAARWTYDEARHTQMGYERLRDWGFEPVELPLGSYIFDSARGEDPVIRLGMLHYFETKNIGKKTRRAASFADYQDKVSQHDMEFDWADETLHAAYGKRWLAALRAVYPHRIPDTQTLHDRCDALVAEEVARATDRDRAESRQIADAMVGEAKRILSASAIDLSPSKPDPLSKG